MEYDESKDYDGIRGQILGLKNANEYESAAKIIGRLDDDLPRVFKLDILLKMGLIKWSPEDADRLRELIAVTHFWIDNQ